MKPIFVLLLASAASIAACETTPMQSVEEIALTRIVETDEAASPTPEPTASPPPTATERPTSTSTPIPLPTSTPMPTWQPIEIGDIESSLGDAGYRRFPFTNEDGVSGFFWDKTSPYETVTTWDDGTVRMQVLHDGAPADRSERMERHLAVLDSALPAGFMSELRRVFGDYNRTAPSSVSGEPDWITASGDEWQTVRADYNTEEFDLGGYGVRFSLRWWQSTCPPQYDYCYYSDFPGLEFTGDSSFVFDTILIWLPEPQGSEVSA